jgi:hypothetical protein
MYYLQLYYYVAFTLFIEWSLGLTIQFYLKRRKLHGDMRRNLYVVMRSQF